MVEVRRSFSSTKPRYSSINEDKLLISHLDIEPRVDPSHVFHFGHEGLLLRLHDNAIDVEVSQHEL